MSTSSFEPPPDEPSAATLLVRHLPEAIPHDLLSRLFSHFGASSFRPCSGGKMRNCAFVDFKDEISASRAQPQLNRLRIHKKVLSVERVTNSFSLIANQSKESKCSADLSAPALPEVKNLPLGGTYAKGNTMGSLSYSEPIAPKLGVEYPFPPHLGYAYPPPDGNILINIVNALIAVPRFYTQVLHVMNKMNIPPPFRMALPTPPLPPSAPAPPPPPPSVSEQPPPADLSSEESELESSEEDLADVVRIRKRAKKEAILGPASDKGVSHEDVGLKPAALVPKEVPMIKKKNRVLQIKIASKSTSKETKDGGSLAEIVNEQENVQPKPHATMEEIENGKLPPEEILSLPMFKNYAAGNPAPVLYIKNLAKDVIDDDFYYIFGSLFDDTDATKSSLHVKLMQEGRMRGQAFVTFPSIDLAHRALNLVNGFVFKGKPMIIQFGRNPAAPKVA